MAAPQANEVRAGLQGSAPHRGRVQPHDGQRPVANERAGRLALGIAPAAWAGSRRWHRVTDRWPANGKVERASGPVRDLLGRGLGSGAGTGKGRAWETRQSVAGSLGPWKAVRLGCGAANN